MNVTATFDELDRLLKRIQPPQSVEPGESRSTILRLADELKAEASKRGLPTSYINEKLSELKHHVGMRLGKGADDGHPVDQHWRWAFAALDSLRSGLCFGPVLEREACG